MRVGWPKRCEEKPPVQFCLLFLYVYSPPPEPALCKLGQPGGLFVLPEVLTLVLRSSFVLFLWAFPLFVFEPLPFWTPFSYSSYLTVGETGNICTNTGRFYMWCGSCEDFLTTASILSVSRIRNECWWLKRGENMNWSHGRVDGKLNHDCWIVHKTHLRWEIK